MATPKCPPADRRYRTIVWALATYTIYTTSTTGNVYQTGWDCLNDAQCAIERCITNQNLISAGFYAAVIDTQENKLVAWTSSPKRPSLEWQTPPEQVPVESTLPAAT